ncbi:MAG TPA: DUF1634 domain-containing protein [Vicinamibacterales bacterium]|jgi:uncharacterized membrane protein|nr:DUF1634 domain-containing protein [Vicinamibacterales bacterium]
MSDDAIERLEVQVGRLLQTGVLMSAACLGIGLVLWIARGSSTAANALLTGGLVVLMMTPLARVVASLIAYVRLRDWFFVGTTVMVFIVLIAAWVLRS